MSQIGNVLKEARESKGLTIDDIQAETKIQRRYIECIESGELDKLPGNFYAKAFIKQYAESVGLNSAELLEQYKDELPADKVDPAAKEMFNRAQKMNDREDFKNKFVDVLPRVILISFIVIAVVATYLFLMSDSDSSSETESSGNSEVVFKAPEEEQEPNVNEPTAEEPTDDSATEAPATETKQEVVPVSAEGDTSVYELKNAPVADYKVTLTATSDCWYEVKDSDGTSLYNGVVKAGESAEVIVPATSTEISITTGNAPGGTVAINGVPIPYQLQPKDVTVQTLVVKPVAAPAQ